MARKKKNENDNDVTSDNFPDKYKKLIQAVSESIESMSTDDLKKQIVDSQKIISEVEKDMDADEQLKVLKEEMKELASSYKETIKFEEAKARFCVHLLNQRGTE